MTAYISVSFSKRKLLEKELAVIDGTLTQFNIAAFIFVDRYQFDPSQEREMMQQAMADIDKCGMLIAETSDKAIGIGIEAGYAKAKGKPVIYIRHSDTAHSTTVSGISDFQIVYSDTADLQEKLYTTLSRILTTQQ